KKMSKFVVKRKRLKEYVLSRFQGYLDVLFPLVCESKFIVSNFFNVSDAGKRNCVLSTLYQNISYHQIFEFGGGGVIGNYTFIFNAKKLYVAQRKCCETYILPR